MRPTNIAHDALTLQLLCAQQPHGYVRVHDRYNWAHVRCVVRNEIQFFGSSYEVGIVISDLRPASMVNDRCAVCGKP